MPRKIFPIPGSCDNCGYDPRQQAAEIAQDAALAQHIIRECDSVTTLSLWPFDGTTYSMWPFSNDPFAKEIVACCKVPHRLARLREMLSEEHYMAVIMDKREADSAHGVFMGVQLEDGNYLVIV